jgi:hypothetical protein
MALGPTQPRIQWGPGDLSLEIKRSGLEADHSPPSTAEVKERVQLYLHSPTTPSMPGAKLKNRDSFTFTFAGVPQSTHGFQFPTGEMMGFCPFATASRPTLEPAQPPIRWETFFLLENKAPAP